MKEGNKRLVNRWLTKAGEDELSLLVLTKEGGAPSTACFLAQQMAEKYLKALLVHENIPFQKVHDLLELESKLIESNANISEIHEELTELNGYYISTRYPGDFPEFNARKAQQAHQAARKVKEFIMQKLNSSAFDFWDNPQDAI